MAAYKARQAKLNARNAFDLVQFAKERYFTDYKLHVQGLCLKLATNWFNTISFGAFGCCIVPKQFEFIAA